MHRHSAPSRRGPFRGRVPRVLLRRRLPGTRSPLHGADATPPAVSGASASWARCSWARSRSGGRKMGSVDLRLVLLALLAERPSHGYELIKALEERSGGFYSPSPGMVYPALTWLEEVGYASVTAEGAKKLYSITDSGHEYLAQHQEAADAILSQLEQIGRKLGRMRETFAGSDEETAAQLPGGLARAANSSRHCARARRLPAESRAASRQILRAPPPRSAARTEAQRRWPCGAPQRGGRCAARPPGRTRHRAHGRQRPPPPSNGGPTSGCVTSATTQLRGHGFSVRVPDTPAPAAGTARGAARKLAHSGHNAVRAPRAPPLE